MVYVEGETDAPYIKRAAELLGRGDLLAKCNIEWIGAKDKRGQGFHTGADAMRQTLSTLKANPKLSSRKVLLLNDNDTKAVAARFENVFVDRIPSNAENFRVKAGIENLLPEHLFTDDMYFFKEQVKDNGDLVTTKTLRKAVLCESVCSAGKSGDFKHFDPVLDIIERFVMA